MVGIYKITSPTGKIYIGQSIDISRKKISIAFKNKPKSESTRGNMKLAWIKRKQDKLNQS